jgi:hypothetical protein
MSKPETWQRMLCPGRDFFGCNQGKQLELFNDGGIVQLHSLKNRRKGTLYFLSKIKFMLIFA